MHGVARGVNAQNNTRILYETGYLLDTPTQKIISLIINKKGPTASALSTIHGKFLFSEDSNLIVEHLNGATFYFKTMFLASVVLYSHHTLFQRGNKWRVIIQNTEASIASGKENEASVSFKERCLGGNYFNFQGFEVSILTCSSFGQHFLTGFDGFLNCSFQVER